MTVIELQEPTRKESRVRLTLMPSGRWQSVSSAAERRVQTAWDAFDWPGYMPGGVEEFAKSISATIIRNDPPPPAPPGVDH